jgi:starch synthase
MRVVLMTREYPPDVYGGAGVHVEYLARELARRIDVEVRCFGEPRENAPDGTPEVRSFSGWDALGGAEPYRSVLQVLSTNLEMSAGIEGAHLVHSHTWYANLAGHLAKLLYGIPHVMTTHSLEPLRPWKAEQTGAGGHALSSFCERTAIEAADAVVAVSAAMRDDIVTCYESVDPDRVHVIRNGIDPEEYRPDPGTDVVERYRIDPTRPSVVFVGRITRQKGITHLLAAAPDIDPEAQLVLCAGAPDTEDISRETEEKLRMARERRPPGSVVWLDRMLPKREVVQLLSHATVFVCPSVYEPLGIVNLEAMACEAPVVATATGGIPEVVEEGVTGHLIALDAVDAAGTPADPARFARHIADRVNDLVRDPERARAWGRAGRRRVIDRFTWGQAADRTVELYERLIRKAA